MKKAMIFAVVVASLACRDVSQSPGGPSFSMAADSGGGGCDATKCQFNARGDAAFVSWFDPGTIEPPPDTGAGNPLRVYGFANMSRNAEQTFLSYSVIECRSWGCTTTRGG